MTNTDAPAAEDDAPVQPDDRGSTPQLPRPAERRRGPLGGLPSWLAAAIQFAVMTVVLLVFTQFVLEGDIGGGRGTPAAIIFQGIVGGALTALTAAGIVISYRTFRILNFAGAALGVGPALVVTTLVAYHPGLPFPISLLIGLLIGAGCGALVDLAFGRRFARAPRLVLTVVSITAAQLLIQYSFLLVFKAPWLPPATEQTPQDVALDRVQRLLPFPGFGFNVGDLPVRFGFPHVFALELVALLLVALGVFFRYTRTGAAIRASAENAERAALLGISTGALGTMVWAIVGALSAGTAVANNLAGNPVGIGPGDVSFLFPPLAAAVLARFRSIPIAAASAVLIGVFVAAMNYTYRDNGIVYSSAALFVVVVVGLVVQRRELFRLESSTTSTWQASEEPRPVPKELLAVGGIRIARAVLILVLLAIVIGFPFLAPVRLQTLGGAIFINAIAVLSLVVLTGWAGQVSLGQWALVGVGALATGKLAQSLPFFIAIPLGVTMTAGVAFLIGLPALRLRGLFLAGATFGFAVFVGAWMVSPRWGREYMPTGVERPKLLFLDFNEERSMYFFCLAALIASIIVVVNLRKSRFGRLLIAIRENEANVQSFGVKVVRMKLYAFMASGALAGFAGALLQYQARGVGPENFAATQSFQLFITAVIGGVAAPAGALIGSAYQNLLTYFFADNTIVQVIAPLLPLIMLFASPGGLLALVQSVRDSVLRLVAQRRQIVVPSLFADYDEEALEHQLIPLSEPTTTDGLAVLPPDLRYTMSSDLYRGHGTRILERLQPPKESAERAAISAAAATDDAPALTTGAAAP
ncbi:MAG TPA: ABC transporter permease [Acidimicrobiales bacterium]